MKAGWHLKTLGDYFDITSSKRVFRDEWTNEGVPFYRAREIVRLARDGFVHNDLYISREMFETYKQKYGVPRADDILVTGVGTLGICHVVRANDEFYFKDGNIIWLQKRAEIDSRFVEYAFKSDFLRDQIDDNVGATVGTFTIIKAKGTKIPVPPIEEQRRIVELLDKAFAGISTTTSNTQKNLTNARALLQRFLDTKIVGSEDGWKTSRFEDIIEDSLIGLVKSTREQGAHHPFPYVKMHNISNNNGFAGENIVNIPATLEEVQKYSIRSGDFLFNTRNSHELVGKTCYFDLPIKDPILFNNNIMRIRFRSGISSKFISYVFSTTHIRRQLEAIKSGTTNVSAIYFRELKNVLISYPDEMPQSKIVGVLDELTRETVRLEAIYNSKLVALSKLKQSLLQKAFAGELT